MDGEQRHAAQELMNYFKKVKDDEGLFALYAAYKMPGAEQNERNLGLLKEYLLQNKPDLMKRIEAAENIEK